MSRQPQENRSPREASQPRSALPYAMGQAAPFLFAGGEKEGGRQSRRPQGGMVHDVHHFAGNVHAIPALDTLQRVTGRRGALRSQLRVNPTLEKKSTVNQ